MNTLKTFFLLMVLTGLLLLIGAMFGGEIGIVMALGFALILNVGAYWFSDRIALGMTHARQVTEEEDPELYRLVAEQASLAGLPMPKVYSIESDSPNAFATGRNPQHATVAATTGIRRLLTREELGAVMAHEMAHVGNRDTLIMSIVATLAGAISMLAMIAQFSAIFGSMGGGRERGGGSIIGLLVVAIVMPIAATIIRLAISRSREFQADATGAKTSGNPEALASALEKLERGAAAHPMKVAESASHLFIVNPLTGKAMANLFSTHPPIEERARRLRSMGPNY
ncbi:MAG: zinc metalloprotease HtpX [Chloroflexi bacterium]|nr:zinc metalloprotease HtpX [Chloroflexota bacterium]MDA1219942.1 zinc metalloprotease HtpX [Chloroflexota bacterium]PKB57963.1 MAG: protease HtpX [SAR202 cluster bacterium Casp-Chloro-G3]